MFAELSVIGIIIAVVVAVLSMIFKNKQEEEPFEVPPELKPRRDRPPPPPRASNWEEELRRVLEHRPEPPPLIQQAPPRLEESLPYAEEGASGTEHEPETQQWVQPPRFEPGFQPLAGLTESTQRYAQASSLQERVHQHMRDVTKHRVGTTVATAQPGRGVAPEFRELVDTFRTPGGARSAIIASIIFGPPRGLES